jgi:hypothetical protein
MSKIIAYCKNRCPHSEATKKLLSSLQNLDQIQKSDQIQIIPVDFDFDLINGVEIGGKKVQSKDEFFNHIATFYNIELKDHRTFPVNIFVGSDGINHFIGGNDIIQTIYNKADTTSDVSLINPHDKCISNFKSFDIDGQRRLYCHFLKILNKIQ